jgi:hypothetical protein
LGIDDCSCIFLQHVAATPCSCQGCRASADFWSILADFSLEFRCFDIVDVPERESLREQVKETQKKNPDFDSGRF